MAIGTGPEVRAKPELWNMTVLVSFIARVAKFLRHGIVGRCCTIRKVSATGRDQLANHEVLNFGRGDACST
jgi:hypothetical protein